MEDYIKFYNLPYHYCSCKNERNEPTHIARQFKNIYERNKNGEEFIDILKDLKISRMCCRKRFLCIPIIPMIDRSSERFYNDVKGKISESTRELKFKNEPPDFPLL